MLPVWLDDVPTDTLSVPVPPELFPLPVLPLPPPGFDTSKITRVHGLCIVCIHFLTSPFKYVCRQSLFKFNYLSCNGSDYCAVQNIVIDMNLKTTDHEVILTLTMSWILNIFLIFSCLFLLLLMKRNKCMNSFKIASISSFKLILMFLNFKNQNDRYFFIFEFTSTHQRSGIW